MSLLSLFAVTTWESWAGAALGTGAGVSGQQADEEDQETREWHHLQTADLRTGILIRY